MNIPVCCLFCQIFQWNIVIIVLAAVLVMVAVNVWLWRNHYRSVHLIGSWFLFLILTMFGSWQAYNEERVFRETWKNMLVGITNSFADTTEIMGHIKISPETSPEDPVYLNIRNLHAQWCKKIPLVAHVYTLRLRSDKANAVSWVVCCEADKNENHRIDKLEETGKNLYQPCDEWLEIYRKGFDGNIALDELDQSDKSNKLSKNVHSTRNGNFITVTAPLRDLEHPEFVEAILGIDFRTDQRDQVIRQIRWASSQSLIILLALYLTSIYLIAVFHRAVSRLTETNQELINTKKSTDAAAKVKNDFLANMNHDIRTQMNVIIGFTDILMHRVSQYGCVQEWEESHGISDIIQKSSHDLLTIINDFIDFSQIEANLLQIESIPLSIKQLIDEIEQTAKPIVAEKKLRFSVRYSEPIPELILGDPARLRQILVNLTDNAIKFTSKGKIEIHCETFQTPDLETVLPHKIKIKIDGHQSYAEAVILKISVYDTGIGISPEQMEHLFQPFAVDHSLTREFGGTGLGLSIVKRLAQLMDGTITVKSEPNVGSVFTLTLHAYLPSKQESAAVIKEDRIKESVGDSFSHSKSDSEESEEQETADTASPKQESAQSPEQPLKNVRILLVEDMHINQLVISTQLRNAGAKVEIAGNGELGIQKITQDMDNGLFFDIILMDMQMPVKDGYEATTQLRSQGYDRPIIAVTAHALTGDREKTIAAGCNDYISKPVDRKILINIVKKFLKSKK
ncbi:MAG: response regulator [Planctomycetaceae bacterium]|jgi:signal transduction histidine kinase/CheY-like chemotaxis protein|nr:response regulator [Planctomycetaceae bacterium]